MSEKAEPTVFLVSERFGHSGGGEAIKAYQYAKFLIERGQRLLVFTHERSVTELGGDLPSNYMRLVPDTEIQKFFWKSILLRFLLQPYFHWKARKLVLEEAPSNQNVLLHYISPVSPVAPRFSPQKFQRIFGPMTGNIYYPAGFRSRMSLKDRFREKAHNIAQIVLGRLLSEKRQALCLLVSGYDRTRASLELAGCRSDQMVDVVDSGVSERLIASPRLVHEGLSANFMCSGRLVDHKGIDLAIRAVAKADKNVILDVYGDGPRRPELESLVDTLGLEGRVNFKGWIPSHDDLIDAFRQYRGYIFPSLAEANGIVMQEAMMVGLPVVALRWGGPAQLADDSSAIYVEPEDEPCVVAGLAQAMNRLARDPDLANTLSKNARQLAEQKFRWEAVAESWKSAYSKEAIRRAEK